MSDDIDDESDQLTVVTSGDALSSIPVSAVSETAHEVVVTMLLPSGDTFSDRFSKPPVWGSNCDLKRLLDHVGIGPDEMDDLVGEKLPCDRTIYETGIEFEIDLDALSE
ncbi:hypothetical protein OB905_00900 [Halobacteria archaeon AArc-dxtr1]|nr:hypothetical protein [Halobacteria archaeon AArc-dxtr1]